MRTFVGVDVATAPDMTVLTMRGARSLWVGDHVYLKGDTHGRHHRVVRLLDQASVEIGQYVRASKGFRRHLRRAKANKGRT